MRRGRELFARTLARLDIPREVLPGGFGLSMSGRGELTVRGCRRILAYAPDCIRLSMGKHTLTVQGESLLCTVFEAGCITIEGCISALVFREGKSDAAT